MMTATSAIRVVIADHQLLMRQAVLGILERDSRISVLETSADGDSLRRAVERHRPDVVVTDAEMRPSGGDQAIAITSHLRRWHPAIGIVALGGSADPALTLALRNVCSDRCAYLLKERINDPQQLPAAVTMVAAGGSIIDPLVIERLVASGRSRSPSPLDDLTARESEVLAQMAQGKSNTAIAASLVLSRRAVEKHVNAIFSKLELTRADGISQRVTAVLMLLRPSQPGPTPPTGRTSSNPDGNSLRKRDHPLAAVASAPRMRADSRPLKPAAP
jgi:DNA-binding NarL/FixJ family response regulator